MKYQSSATSTGTYYHVPNTVPKSALLLGSLGAVVGAGNAVAKSNRQVKNGEINRQQAVEQVMNETVGTGLAVAAAAAVVGAARTRGVVSLVGILAISAGAKYIWDTATSPIPAKKEMEASMPAEAAEPETSTKKDKPAATGQKSKKK